MPAPQPNILLITADQMACDAIGALGHPVVVTPNLDRLASSGTVFTNTYCNSPLCAPSRACLATGRLMRHTGVFDNAAELPASIPTLMHLLRLNGYHTIASGKLHFVGPDQLHGFEERLTTDVFPSDFGWTPDWSLGPVTGKTNVSTVGEAGICDWNVFLRYDEEVVFRTLEKLRELSVEHGEQPFFFQVNFTHPHPPFQALKRFHDLYEEADIPLPVTAAKAADTDPRCDHPYDRWLQIMHGLDKLELTDEEIRKARKTYYAMISYVDDAVGRILAELYRLGLAETTRVVFTSDHGELLGEHGNWFKRHYFEQCLKVPLIVAGPGIPPAGEVDNILSLVDLTATLAGWGGVSPDELTGMDGVSFAGLLRDRPAEWEKEMIFEYAGKGTIRYMAGIRSDRYKFVYVHGESPLLFDLENDPQEERNLADLPELADLRGRLQSKLLAGIDPAEMQERILDSQRRRLLINRSVATGRKPQWDHQPDFNAAARYIRV